MADAGRVDDLAIMGGRPSFDETLHVGRPNVGDPANVLRRIGDALERRWLANDGPFVQDLERRLTELLDVRHCVLTCNATVALGIVVKALDLRGEVIVPSWTFIATAHALQWHGVKPVFADIDADTHNLDPAAVEAAITPATTAIMAVHLWGRPCEVESLAAIARRHGVRLIFDASHAFACSRGGRMVGGFGDAEVFSFHATKFFNTFEGGAVTTNDTELADRVRLMRNFGFAGYDRTAVLGTNGKMHEISAAMGLASLDELDGFIAVNRRNHAAYREGLQQTPGLRVLEYDETERGNYQYVVVEIDEAVTGLARDELVEVLWAENVQARRYFHPGCHRMEPYRSTQPDAGLTLPMTELVAARVLSLPTGSAVGIDRIATICSIIRTALAGSSAIRRQLAAAPLGTGPMAAAR